MQDFITHDVFLALSRAESSPRLLAALSADEHKTVGKLLSARRREEFICARGLLRHLLQKATGRPAASHVISATDEGKPVCPDGPGVSISHAGGMVICAVAVTGDVGIDIEYVDASRNTKRLAEEYFAPEENDWLDRQPEEGFYSLWVLKEACLKALGCGLAGGLDRLRCRIEPPSIEAALHAPTTFNLRLFEMPDDAVPS